MMSYALGMKCRNEKWMLTYFFQRFGSISGDLRTSSNSVLWSSQRAQSTEGSSTAQAQQRSGDGDPSPGQSSSQGRRWTSLWINLMRKVNQVRGKSLWEVGLLPLKRWKEWGQQLHQHLSTLSTPFSAVKAGWVFQSCNFTRQRREDKALWPPPNTLIPSANSYFSDA